jgi:predicted N-acetyltransferase YhbS
MQLVDAGGELLERILDITYPLWHEDLTRQTYGRLNAAQTRTPWGGQHLQRVALLDDGGALLATAKRYRLDARLAGRVVRLCGLAAVFTPPDRRGRGHATALIERLIEQERAQGAAAILLFSEIGPGFYERLSFTAVPIDEVTVTVAIKPGAPAMLVRAGDERDLPAIVAMHAARSDGVVFSLRRDAPLIHHALTKKRLFAGLSRHGRRQVEFFVAEEGASAVAYVILTTTDRGWTLEEAGDRDPAGARLGAILQGLVAREPSHEAPLIRAWWPRTFPVPPQMTLADRTDARDVMMMRALTDVPLPAGADDVFYWRSDYL